MMVKVHVPIAIYALFALSGCGSPDPGATDSSPATATGVGSSSTTSQPCAAPLAVLQTGPDATCAGGNLHKWPLGLDVTDCHGWTASDGQGSVHENSAAAIGCNPDGSFSFTQYAGNLDCSGSGVTKTFLADQCEQDIPPSLYTMAVDLSCCEDPTGSECTRGMPSVSVPNGIVYLNGSPCEP